MTFCGKMKVMLTFKIIFCVNIKGRLNIPSFLTISREGFQAQFSTYLSDTLNKKNFTYLNM